MTNSKELVESALRREEVDRIPFCPPFQGYWALNLAGVSVMDSIRNPKMAAEAQFKVVEPCCMDAVEIMWDWLLPAEAMGCGVNIPEHGTIPTLTHIIDEPGRLDELEIPEINDFYRFTGAKDTAAAMAEKLGKEHFLMCSILSPFTLSGELRGVEQMMMDCLMEEEFIHNLVSKSLEILTVFVEDMVKWDTDAVIICDPTASGDLISAPDYANFSASSMKALGDVVRKGGKTQIDHICGDTSDRLEIVADTGCAAFSVDYQVDLKNAVTSMNNRMAIIGNLDPAGILYCGTPEDVKTNTQKLLEAGGKKGYLFGSGCDIPVGTAYENVLAMSKVFMNF